MIKFHHRFTINLIQPTIPRYNLSLHPIHPNSPSSPHFILETSIIKGSFPQRMKFFLSLSFSPFQAFSINFFPSTGRPSNIIQLRFVRWFRGLSTSKRSFISQLVVARKAEMTSRVSTRPVVATASRCLSYRGKRVHKRVSWRQPEAHRIDNISWERGRGRGERERGGICRAMGPWHAILSRQTSTLVINAGLGWRAGVGSWRWVFGDDSWANYRVVARQWRMIWEISKMDSRWLRWWCWCSWRMHDVAEFGSLLRDYYFAMEWNLTMMKSNIEIRIVM